VESTELDGDSLFLILQHEMVWDAPVCKINVFMFVHLPRMLSKT